jgi:hypothetical protein
MHFSRTAWIESRDTDGGGRGKTWSLLKKHESIAGALSLHGVIVSGRHLLVVSFCNKPAVNQLTVCTALTERTEHYRILLHYLTGTKHDCTAASYTVGYLYILYTVELISLFIQ